jgi:Fur family zinc uptake transcriptional regulator
MSKNILKIYDQYCVDNGVRVSDPRRFVLEIISAAKKPLTAYDILERLAAKLKNPKPPTAYRALEALTAYGFVHRIESLNAYIACHENHRHNGSQFMICDFCGRVEEIHLCHIPESLQKQASAKSFTTRHWNVELHGTCGQCHKRG